MTAARPIWFGPGARPLFGFFHAPPGGSARAGVVVCPPVDRDAMHAHYALRLLAEQLAGRGLAVLRLDYDGTGDSAGDPGDPDRVAAWLGSVEAAAATLRHAGAAATVLVGMRLGATLAGVVAERRGGAEGLVLWDPVVSGRAYLTEQRALRLLSLRPAPTSAGPNSTTAGAGLGPPPPEEAGVGAPAGPNDPVEVPGAVYDAATARDLAALDLARTTGPLARRVLVLTRSGQPEGRLGTRFGGQAHVAWGEATGQDRLLDVGSPNQVLPEAAIERVAGWVADVTAALPVRPLRLPAAAGPAVVAGAGTDRPVTETPERLGTTGLFGVRTEVAGAASGPTVLFLNVANEPRIGPARLWVALARHWATAGVRSFRLDLSGLGDSPTRRPGQRRFVTRAPEAFDDVQEACRALCPEDPGDVVLVGLCASAYQALDSAFDVWPRGVVSVNPVLSFRPPEVAAGRRLDPRRHVAIPRRAATQALHGNGPVVRLRHHLPRLGERARDLAESVEGLLAPRRHRPAAWLGELTGRGVDVLVVCGEREARPIRLSGTARTFRRLAAGGRFHLRLVPGLEHGLLVADQRDEVAAIVTGHVLALTGHDGAGASAVTPAGILPAPA